MCQSEMDGKRMRINGLLEAEEKRLLSKGYQCRRKHWREGWEWVKGRAWECVKVLESNRTYIIAWHVKSTNKPAFWAHCSRKAKRFEHLNPPLSLLSLHPSLFYFVPLLNSHLPPSSFRLLFWPWVKRESFISNSNNFGVYARSHHKLITVECCKRFPSQSHLFHCGIFYEKDLLSSQPVIKQHPWVQLKRKQAQLISHVLSLFDYLSLTRGSSFSFTCSNLNHLFPFILILIIPLHYHFYSLICIFCFASVIFFPSLIPPLSSSITQPFSQPLNTFHLFCST